MEKRELLQRTVEILGSLTSEFNLTQKEIAERAGIKNSSDLTKMKNPDPLKWGEVSVSRRKNFLSKLEELYQRLRNGESNSFLLMVGKNQGIKIAATAGAFSGVFTCLITIFFKDQMGYSNIAIENFHQVVPFMFLAHIVVGAFIGAFCALTSWKILFEGTDYLKATLVSSLVVFFVVTIVRGLKARDAYLIAGLYSEKANGLLGEPNFEVLGSSLAFALSAVFIIRFFSVKRIYTSGEALHYAFIASLGGAFLFIFTYSGYKLLLFLEVIEKGGSIINTAIFKFSFSHPERVPWIWLFVFACVYFVLEFTRREALRGGDD